MNFEDIVHSSVSELLNLIVPITYLFVCLFYVSNIENLHLPFDGNKFPSRRKLDTFFF